MTWSTPSASMSFKRACGSRQPASRPNFACHSGVPGVSAPTSFFFQPGQPDLGRVRRARARPAPRGR